MAKIQFKNLNLGGIADSDYLGAPNSVAEMVGLDIHSEAGVLKANWAMIENSGSVVDDFCQAAVATSNGSTVFFGSNNGKVWERDGSGVWTYLGATTSNRGVLDAREYKGYIYYAQAGNLLGRWQLGTAWSTRNDSWATFTVSSSNWHPMIILNDVLYIGSAYHVAQVDGSTFSAEALDIDTALVIKSFGRLNTDLLVGAAPSATNSMAAQVIRWNTWSVSFSYSDPVPESEINCFLDTDNNVIVSAGVKGNLYLYNGAQLEFYKKLKGDFSNITRRCQVFPTAKINMNGIPFFGLSSSQAAGNPVLEGVYSLHKTNASYPIVLNLEYPISTGVMTNVRIGAMVPLNYDRFFVAWYNTSAGTYGVDLLSADYRQTTTYFITRVIALDRIALTMFKLLHACYKLLPTNTSFKFYKKLNNATSWTEITSKVTDTKRQIVSTKVDVNEGAKLQLKVEIISSGANTPELEMVELDVDA